jgi:phosphoglycolate phosphatase-like HAD superfamily hydrolase
VIFDYDDTIVASKSHRRDALLRTITAMGREPSLDGFERSYGKSFADLIAALDPDGSFDSFFDSYLIEVAQRPAPLLPGVESILDRLDEIQITASILSSSDSRLIRAELATHGLANRFRVVRGSEVGVKKPEPAAIAECLFEMDLGAEVEAICVGDSLSDWKMAQQAGVGFVAVCTGSVTRAEFIASGLPSCHICDDLFQVASLLTGNGSP